MKRCVLILCAILIGTSTQADPVRDVVLSTTDRACSIHYLTHGNTTGWFLSDIDGSCANGMLSGKASVIVRNAFGQTEEQLIGYFNQGYWTGVESINTPLKTLLLNHDSEEQFLTYDLGKENRLDIRYLGKMTATRRSDDTYGPFLSCDPVRILAVTSDTDLFADEKVQHNLISSAVQRARSICPQAMQIQFYGAIQDNPQNEDVFFFADVDLDTKHVKVRRIPNASRTRKTISIEENLKTTEIPKQNAENNIQISETIPPTKIIRPAEINPITEVKENPIQSVPVLDTETEIRLDKIPHLLTASRLLKQPVEGKALVHIAYFDGIGEAVTDKPVALKIKGSELSLGWGVMTGDFTYLHAKNINEPRGMVESVSFTPYNVSE